ncbi:MAG: ATP-binding protein [Acidimicrobiia bacterium]|nr:ATP-binding protein [Acidimicrobiia bacterium]
MSLDSEGASGTRDPIRNLSGEVRVASRIIDYLSSGLYATPGACLKELVNNSYDADASYARLSVKPSAYTVTLEDDGVGMTAAKFEAHFRKIADSRKRDTSHQTERGRKKIGKIGIGFIAANELCNQMRIESTVHGSTELLDVTVDFQAMRDDPADRRDEDGTLHKGDYDGHVFETDIERQFTRVTLSDLTSDAQNALIRAEREEHQPKKPETLYGLRPDSVRDVLGRLRTWSDLDLYSQTMAQVGLNVPVSYPGHWLASNLDKRSKKVEEVEADFTKRADDLGFTVVYDGTDLRKPVVLPAQRQACLVRTISYKGENVSYHGYLFASHGTIAPTELQGVLLRVKEAAIGGYSQDLLGFPQSRFSLLQRWVSGEIYASDELEEAMNIDRSTLRETHPAFVELRRTFHDELAGFLSEAREVLYKQPSDRRRKREAKEASERIVDRLRAPREGSGTEMQETSSEYEPAAHAVQERADSDPSSFTRKLTTAELFELVTEVADEILPPAHAGRFLEALANSIFRRGRSGRSE